MGIDRWPSIIPLRLRSLFRRNEVEQELDEELQYHIEQQTAENIRHGMLPDGARWAAVRALGGLEFRKEQVRDTRGTRWIEELVRDVTFALRSLRHARGFATAVVLTLALGIGANTAMFTLLRGTLLRPLPNRDGDRLVLLRQSAVGTGQQNLTFSVPEVVEYRASSRTLSAIAEYSRSTLTLAVGDDAPVHARAGIVSGNYFAVMGLEPILGRPSARDDGAAATPVVVISHEYWIEHFGGDSSIVGQTVRINGKSGQVIGVVQVAPSHRRNDIYVNMVTSAHHMSAAMVTNRVHRMTDVFARLAPGVTVDQARIEIGGIASNMVRLHPEAYETASQFAVTVSPLRTVLNERASLTLWLLMAAAAFVLLIACANVANLTLMRGVRRERELVVRAALGAGRWRLRRLLIAENLTLSLVGGALGIAVAIAGVRALVFFAAQLTPRASEIRVDGLVLAVGLITSIAVAVALSFVPRIGGDDSLAAVSAPLGRRGTLGRARHRFQQTLVVTQVAVCMILLTAAGLLVRTITKLQSVDSGVSAEHVLTIETPLESTVETALADRPRLLATYERIRDRVAALPGVDRVALASQVPLRSANISFDVKAEGRSVPANEPIPRAEFRAVDPNYFDVAGIPVLEGRAFATTDHHDAPRVVLLSQTFARRLFGDVNPIGRRVAWSGEVLKFTPFTDEWRTVVGIVGDTRDEGVSKAPTLTMFVPFAQEVIVNGDLVVRTTKDPAPLQPAIIRAIRAVSPKQMIERIVTLDQIRDETVAPRRLNAIFVAGFGALALVIAMVGIAGVLAFSVSSRTGEIGIRMSLGANAGQVHRMVLGEGGVLLASGLVVGTMGALLMARFLGGLLYGVTPQDPTTLSVVAAILAVVGIAACWIPADRAARVDPAVALRAE